MKKLLRLAALSAVAFSLTTGVAAANSGSISDTGPDSINKVKFENRSKVRLENTNRVRVQSNSAQSAFTGDARVTHNTTGGSARTGDAANDNLVRATVSSNNSNSSSAALENGCGCLGSSSGTIDNTGPDSVNKITFADNSSVKVKNTNNVSVQSNSAQTATSGDAKVSDNTTGGDATSGNASNINTTELTFTSVN